MTDVKPLVSIIVAIYNVRDYLPLCLNSILEQTYSNVETILVDDGSTDGSEVICDEYAARGNNIKVLHQVNGGLYSARNTGLKAATGSYLYFMDGDDWIEPELVTDAIASAQSTNADIVLFGHSKELRLTSGLINIIPVIPPEIYFSGRESVLSGMPALFRVGCGFAVWEQLIRASVLRSNNIGFPAYRRGSDMGFLFEVYGHCNSLKTVAKGYYHYNAFNAVNKFNPRLIEIHEELFKKYLYVFQSHRPFQAYTVQLFILWFGHVIPTNIVSNETLTYTEKLNWLKTLKENSSVKHWTQQYTVRQAKGFLAKSLLVVLKSGSSLILYIVTSFKIFIKSRLLVNYKKWFYQ